MLWSYNFYLQNKTIRLVGTNEFYFKLILFLNYFWISKKKNLGVGNIHNIFTF